MRPAPRSGVLAEVFPQLLRPARICPGRVWWTKYEHKHRQLRAERDPTPEPARLVVDIAASLIRNLSSSGVQLTRLPEPP
jgi:hypothetical protein